MQASTQPNDIIKPSSCFALFSAIQFIYQLSSHSCDPKSNGNKPPFAAIHVDICFLETLPIYVIFQSTSIYLYMHMLYVYFFQPDGPTLPFHLSLWSSLTCLYSIFPRSLCVSFFPSVFLFPECVARVPVSLWDFEVAYYQVPTKSRRKTWVLKLQSVKFRTKCSF